MLASVNLAVTEGAMVLANTWGTPDNTGGKGPEFGKAAPVGLAVILGLLLVIMLLARSMNRRIRNLPKSFDESETDDGQTGVTAGAATGPRSGGGGADGGTGPAGPGTQDGP